MPRLRNKALPNTTMFKSNGIPIHGRLVLQFFMMVINGVQGVILMLAYATRFVLATTTKYPISIRNDEIRVVLIENGLYKMY